MKMDDIVKGVKLNKTCTIRLEKGSKDVKTVQLKVNFDGVTLGDVFAKALAGAVIQWQNGPGRKNFDKWENNQVVNINFKSPGAQPEMSVMDRFKAEAKADGVDVNDKDALKEYIMQQITKV